MTTTTIVDTGTPPTLPTPWTAPTIDYREALTPHRSLPDTGSHDLLLPSAGLLLSVGLLLTVWARRARQKRTQRYFFARIKSWNGEPTRWGVYDRATGWGKVTDFRTKDAAETYAQVLNANLSPLSERNQP